MNVEPLNSNYDNDVNKQIEQYLVINNLYGKITKNPLNFKVQQDNYQGNNTQKVLLDNQVEAFLETTTDNYSFDYRIIASEIANLFDVKAVPIYRFITNGTKKGIVYRSNTEIDEVALNFSQIAKSLYKKIQSGAIDGRAWLESISQLPQAMVDKPITNHEDLKKIIELPIYVAAQSFANMPKIKFIKFRQEYFAMLMIDYLLNQPKRALEDYSMVVNKKTNEPSFGALSSYGSPTDSKIKANEYFLNILLVDREALIECLYKSYYEDIEDFSRMVADYLPDYKKSVELIIKNNFKTEDYQPLLSAINLNLEKICSLEKSYRNEQKNSIDLTQTNIGIQLKAKRNNNEVAAKYPDQDVVAELSSEEVKLPDDGIKLTLEPDNRRSGFINKTIIFLLVAFVCGIGVGIGYIIFNLSGM